jgi:hypothetical protein
MCFHSMVSEATAVTGRLMQEAAGQVLSEVAETGRLAKISGLTGWCSRGWDTALGSRVVLGCSLS